MIDSGGFRGKAAIYTCTLARDAHIGLFSVPAPSFRVRCERRGFFVERAMPWKLDHCRAQLELERLTGAIDLTRPADGITELVGPQGPMVAARLLGVAIPGFVAGERDALIECYQRGPTLAVAYRESARWPARLDAQWRLISLPAGAMAIDLILSVRTYSLSCQPTLSVFTAIRSDEVVAVDLEGRRCGLQITEDGWTSLGTPATCCLVFRRPEMSYAQMVHPGDFSRDELLCPAERIVPQQYRHQLFPQPLEKGVIVRTRIRGVLLPRDEDLCLAAIAAQQFAAEEPPLD
jgi:hypothetical protein